jgi:RNA polymerase sigma-70 factor (ECF subfamily)
MESLSGLAAKAIDPGLLGLVAKGDREAFSELYDRSCQVLFGLSLRILESREEAEDVLQEVYAEVWRKSVRYDERRGSPIAWLVTLTRSRAIDRLRARAARGYHATESLDPTLVAEIPADRPDAFQEQATAELRKVVSEALAALPADQRIALELAYYEGLSQSEIAERLQAPLGTVKTRIKLAMGKLRAALQSAWDHD